MVVARKPVGEIILEKGLINASQLKQAIAEQVKTGEPIGKVLTRMDFISEDQLVTELSKQLKIPFVDLENYDIDPAATKAIAENLCRKNKTIPISIDSNIVTLAMENPLDINAIDEIKRISRYDLKPIFATPSAIENAINARYGTLDSPDKVASKVESTLGRKTDLAGDYMEMSKTDLEKAAVDSSVVKFVDSVIKKAVELMASDIHMEPTAKDLTVRLRVDGVLHENARMKRELQAAVISRIKIMSNLDIAERRLPQDGRIETNVGNKEIELRVSTFPTIYGENVVMRILDRSTALIELEELGFTKDKQKQFEKIISLPYGILLVTGPTGSGKTTTLYAALKKIRSVEENIITIEDPVEYRLEGIRQTQVNPKAGLTFANGLRFMLRQDPDIMMIGEVRDLETAELAIRSALTGHFVFTTLHTNDAPGALTRLTDMGVEKFLISSSVVGCLAQRLLRKLCTKCKEPYTPEEGILKVLGIDDSSKKYTFYKEKGCKQCMGTGYKGRIGIFELLEVTETIQHMILQDASLLDIKKEAIRAGMRTLRQDAAQKVMDGMTSLSEIMQVT